LIAFEWIDSLDAILTHWAGVATSQVIQVRWVVKATRNIVLPTIPNGVIYGALAEAHREGGGERAVPEGCMALAPEWCRTRVLAGEDYALASASSPNHGKQLSEQFKS
jgi:hypothetical protein